jgi:Acyl-CoA dehydrogenase, C-terminal domain
MERAELALFTRGVRDATESASGAALDAALAELGWLDALDTDPQAAVSVLFECQGAANATSSALERVFARGLGLRDEVASGIVFPALRTVETPGSQHGARWAVRGVAFGALASSDTALVIVSSDVLEPAVLHVSADDLDLRQVAGLDPALGLIEVTGDIDAGPRVARGHPVGWTEAVSLGQLALGSELVGAARTMLELARQHALDRVQFGRTIGTFQAVRHRLADSFVAIEAAASLLDAAWLDPVAYGGMAKSFAGRQARLVARHCQQVLAGMGFTAEHSFHHFVRRTIVLDQLLGAGTVLTRDLGTEVLANGVLPPAFPL